MWQRPGPGSVTGIGDRDCSTKIAIVKLMQVLVLKIYNEHTLLQQRIL